MKKYIVTITTNHVYEGELRIVDGTIPSTVDDAVILLGVAKPTGGFRPLRRDDSVDAATLRHLKSDETVAKVFAAAVAKANKMLIGERAIPSDGILVDDVLLTHELEMADWDAEYDVYVGIRAEEEDDEEEE